MTFIIYEWMEASGYITRWKGYNEGVIKIVQDCIRNYRYSGGFIRYVFRTLEYSARALRPTVSLDDRFYNTKKRRIDFIRQDDEEY